MKARERIFLLNVSVQAKYIESAGIFNNFIQVLCNVFIYIYIYIYIYIQLTTGDTTVYILVKILIAWKKYTNIIFKSY